MNDEQPPSRTKLDWVIAAYRENAGEDAPEHPPALDGDILEPALSRAELEARLLRLIDRQQTAETTEAEHVVRPSLIL